MGSATAGTHDPPQRAERLAVVAVGAALFTWRLLELSRHGEPVGVDFANFARIAQSWTGAVDLGGVVYPPIVPALVAAVRWVAGDVWASRLLQAGAGVAPAYGVWIATRPHVRARWAAGAALALGVSTATSAAVAWGGTPQLLALGVMPVAVGAATRWTEHPSRRMALRCGALATIVGLISTLILVAVAVAVTIALALALIDRRWRWVTGAGWACAPLVVLAPWYLPIVSRQRLPAGRATAVRGITSVDGVLGMPRPIWVVAFAIAFVGCATAWTYRERAPHTELWRTLTALMVAAIASLALTELRAVYIVPSCLAVAICGLSFATAFRGVITVGSPLTRQFAARAPAIVLVVLQALLVWMVVVAPSRMRSSTEAFSAFTPEGTIRAVGWLDQHVRSTDRVLAASVEGVPTGWWLEAHGTDAIVSSGVDWLFFESERDEAVLADGLLGGGQWPTGADLERLRSCSVNWVFLPRGWDGSSRRAIDAAVAAGGIEIEFTAGRTVIVRVLDDSARLFSPDECAAAFISSR